MRYRGKTLGFAIGAVALLLLFVPHARAGTNTNSTGNLDGWTFEKFCVAGTCSIICVAGTCTIRPDADLGDIGNNFFHYSPTVDGELPGNATVTSLAPAADPEPASPLALVAPALLGLGLLVAAVEGSVLIWMWRRRQHRRRHHRRGPGRSASAPNLRALARSWGARRRQEICAGLGQGIDGGKRA